MSVTPSRPFATKTCGGFQPAAALLARMHLADVSQPDPAAPIHQIGGGPVLVVQGVPVGVIVVEQVRVLEPVAANLGEHGRPIPLVIELGRVDADDGQALLRIAL